MLKIVKERLVGFWFDFGLCLFSSNKRGIVQVGLRLVTRIGVFQIGNGNQGEN